MKRKLYILASCRVHRTFNCDKNHETGLFSEYDTQGTIWSGPNFFGSVYCSNYIKQILKSLITRSNKDSIVSIFPNEEKFGNICDSLYESDLIIIEISTMKSIITTQDENNIYLSNEHLHKINGSYNKYEINKEELKQNILDIQNMLKKINKKVLFVSHFIGSYHIKPRQIIINTLKKHCEYFFNPTHYVKDKKYLQNNTHYTKEGESHIMNELHKKITQII